MNVLDSMAESTQRTERDIRPFLVGWVLYFVTALSIGIFALRGINRSVDFRSFYVAGFLLRTDRSHVYDLIRQQQVQSTLISSGNLPSPFFHPIYEALLYAPFSLLPYERAYACYLIFNLLLLACTFFYAYRLFSAPIPLWQPRPGLMVYPFLPLLLSIWYGQNALIFLALCCLVWLQLEKGADFRAGSLLALGLFKFPVSIPLAILCAARRSWKFSTGFIAGSAAVLTLCILIAGPAEFVSFLHHIVTASLLHDQSDAAQVQIAVFPNRMVNLVGLLSPLTQHLSTWGAFVVVAVLTAGLFGACLYLVCVAVDERVAFAIAVLCALLISYHMYIADATLILLPMALLSRQLSKLLLLATYSIPLIVLLGPGRDWSFLLAIPTIWMLIAGSRMIQQPSVVIEQTAA